MRQLSKPTANHISILIENGDYAGGYEFFIRTIPSTQERDIRILYVERDMPEYPERESTYYAEPLRVIEDNGPLTLNVDNYIMTLSISNCRVTIKEVKEVYHDCNLWEQAISA